MTPYHQGMFRSYLDQLPITAILIIDPMRFWKTIVEAIEAEPSAPETIEYVNWLQMALGPGDWNRNPIGHEGLAEVLMTAREHGTWLADLNEIALIRFLMDRGSSLVRAINDATEHPPFSDEYIRRREDDGAGEYGLVHQDGDFWIRAAALVGSRSKIANGGRPFEMDEGAVADAAAAYADSKLSET